MCKWIMSLFCFLSVSAYAASSMDTYLGKWAMPEYGCYDEDGKGVFYIEKTKAGYALSGYEMYFTLMRIKQVSMVNEASFKVSAFGKSQKRFQGDEDAELQFAEIKRVTQEDAYTYISGIFKQPRMIYYCGKT